MLLHTLGVGYRVFIPGHWKGHAHSSRVYTGLQREIKPLTPQLELVKGF